MSTSVKFQMNSNFLLLALILIVFACSSDDEDPVDCNAVNVQLSVSNVIDATCNQNNGGFDVTVSGGTGPYDLTITGAGTRSIPNGVTTIESFPSGNYNLSLSDANNCSTSSSVTIADINTLTLDSQMEVSGCESSNGTITIEASGGTAPFRYSLDGGASQPGNMFSNLAKGDYTVLVTDDDGCEASVTVAVTTGVGFNDTIKPIIDTDCAINNCHDGSNTSIPDWSDFATVQTNAANIKARTGNETMPPPGRPDLTAEQIQLIACWVDDGALNN